MSIVIDIIQPLISSKATEDMDRRTHVDVFDTYDLRAQNISVRKLLAMQYGVEAHLSATNPDNEDKLKYKGSGLYYKSRGSHGEIELNFDVGCHCDHDCCGHMCGLNLTVQKSGHYLTIITEMRFNY